MSDTAVANELYDLVMEGVTPEARAIMDDGIRAFSKDQEKFPTFTDKVKSQRLRKGFDAIQRQLLEKIETLNENQILFLSTGALADKVTVAADANQDEVTVDLLDRKIYDGLLDILRAVPELPEELDYIMTSLDRARMIAMEELVALDPQQEGKRRKKPEKTVDQNDPKYLKEQALSKKKTAMGALSQAIPMMQKLMDAFSASSPEPTKAALKAMGDYLQFAKTNKAPADMADVEKKIQTAGPTIKKYTEENAKALLQTMKLAEKFAPLVLEMRKAIKDLEGLAGAQSQSLRKKFVSYDAEKLGKIKMDFGFTGPAMAAMSEAAATRNQWSGTRVMINGHFNTDNPLEDQIVTPQKVDAAFKKILAIHPNLFPKNAADEPIIPPVIIEPVRNVVEWMDDRFVISAVSGEPAKKGPQFSLNPIEMQVFRMGGMFLSKDSMFNFRGEQNVGTFMGDYSGKIEKNAKVVFAGADKKMTMVASAKQVDSAGRDTAVEDYMDLLFNLLNGLGPNPKLSKRKICIIFRYVIFKDLQNTVNMMLRFAAQTELSEVKDSVLQHVKNDYARAKKLVEDAWTTDEQVPRILGPKPRPTMTKMFG